MGYVEIILLLLTIFSALSSIAIIQLGKRIKFNETRITAISSMPDEHTSRISSLTRALESHKEWDKTCLDELFRQITKLLDAKQDKPKKKGRKSSRDWGQVIAVYKANKTHNPTLSIKKFCKDMGVSERSFRRYKNKGK